jgi:ABC-type branched-subunit amino acid transport system substrate-binding protein
VLRVGAALSLSGRYARFGVQAASALETWARSAGGVALAVEDDRGDAAAAGRAVRDLAGRCDLLLGPYSTGLTRAAVRALEDTGRLLWNHGGAGDDVQAAAPGRVVSVLTPAGRYAEPLLRRLAAAPERAPLWVLAGRGAFGRQVAAGAEATAGRLGLAARRVPAGAREAPAGGPAWDLLCAGAFEEDLAAVRWARALARPPRTLCAVAAGVREFGEAAGDPADVLGIAQWLPGAGPGAEVGPGEAEFLAAHARRSAGVPDYPAIQAVAAAALAARCAALAGSADGAALWRAATSLTTTTLFGPFAVDPASGAQVRHETVLARWTRDGGLDEAEPAVLA